MTSLTKLACLRVRYIVASNCSHFLLLEAQLKRAQFGLVRQPPGGRPSCHSWKLSSDTRMLTAPMALDAVLIDEKYREALHQTDEACYLHSFF